MSDGHRIRYTRVNRGREPVTARRLFGWALRCECGWAARVNDAKPIAVRLGRRHRNAHGLSGGAS